MKWKVYCISTTYIAKYGLVTKVSVVVDLEGVMWLLSCSALLRDVERKFQKKMEHLCAIRSSPSDKRQYKAIRLKNGLKAVIIRDPEIQKGHSDGVAACKDSVLSDPTSSPDDSQVWFRQFSGITICSRGKRAMIYRLLSVLLLTTTS